MTQAPPRRRRGVAHAAPRIEAGALLFDRYRLQRRIGRGGTADVWQARDERLDRTVAIKALHPHLLPDAASRARFATEARAAAGLSHPAIVPVHDVIEDADAPAIVLAFVDGSTLAQRLARDGAMPASIAASIAADVAGALAHAHRAGVVHRDVKPGNVLIDGDGRVQLVDFGIARLLADAAARDTATGQVMGTLRYMAPEQLAGQPVDERTDLYALGLVLHELLAGRPAFGAGSPAALVDAQRAGPPTAPAGTPPELASLLGELLAVDPNDRPATATLVEARLRALAGADRIAPQPDAPAGPKTTGSVGQTSTIAQPTIAAGLPAAAVGLALLAPRLPVAAPPNPLLGAAPAALDGHEPGDPTDPADPADPGEPTGPREPETLAFEAPPTVSVPVVANVAPAPPDPQTAPATRATRRGVSFAVLAGGGLAAGAIALALALAGARGEPASLLNASDVPTPLITASTTPRPVAPTPAQHKPPKGHGHHGGK